MYKQEIILLVYNKDVVCVLEENNSPICKLKDSEIRRNNNNNIPSHTPYIPNIKGAYFYNCSSSQCDGIKIYSIIQVTPIQSNLKICYQESDEKYLCRTLNYYQFKDIDKVLFLSNNIRDKTFFLIDCLAYADGGRVCHKKNEVDSYTKLIDTGNIARPNETNILSQDEFVCQQSASSEIACDLNRYVSYIDGHREKKIGRIDKKILLKTGANVFILNYGCRGNWCGYSGKVKLKRISRRFDGSTNRVYRCFKARKQQVCKLIHDNYKSVYNLRDWISS